MTKKLSQISHCLKSVRIRSFYGSYFPAFGLNMKVYSLNLHIHPECGKVRTRKTPNMGTYVKKTITIRMTMINYMRYAISKYDCDSGKTA